MNAHSTPNISDEVQTCKMLVMTSALNHEETKNFFDLNKYFRAKSSSIVFFQQAVLPLLSEDGKILMEGPTKI